MGARSGWPAGRIVGAGALVLAGAGIAATATAAAITSVVMARRVVTPPTKREEDASVLAVDGGEKGLPGTLTLTRTPDVETPGRYGFWFTGDMGHARIADIVDRSAATITRVVESVEFGDLRQATRGRINAWYYLKPDDLGLPGEEVMIPTELGGAPAWFLPAAESSDRWVIQVHGWGSARPEGLRAVGVFRDAGYNSLLVSYRNDGDAPSSADGRYRLGATEWHDVDAAIRYAIGNGASSVVLMGWSMGGAISLQTATRSEVRHVIRGIVLDSPAIDWVNTLEFQGQLLKLPAPVTRGALALIGAPWGKLLTGLGEPINLASLDFVTHAQELAVPTLIMHSDDDGFVPATGSRALAEARPDIVTYVQFRVARHTKLWNYDPERWNGSIAAWLAALPSRLSR